MDKPEKKKPAKNKPNEMDEIVMDYGEAGSEDEDKILDRRKSPRMLIAGQVVCLPLGGKREIRGEMLDYSEGGIYFCANRKMALTDIVQVSYTVDDSGIPKDSIAQVVRVIKSPKGFEIALQFMSEI